MTKVKSLLPSPNIVFFQRIIQLWLNTLSSVRIAYLLDFNTFLYLQFVRLLTFLSLWILNTTASISFICRHFFSLWVLNATVYIPFVCFHLVHMPTKFLSLYVLNATASISLMYFRLVRSQLHLQWKVQLLL